MWCVRVRAHVCGWTCVRLELAAVALLTKSTSFLKNKSPVLSQLLILVQSVQCLVQCLFRELQRLLAMDF